MSAVATLAVVHTKDEDCTLDADAQCIGCGVSHTATCSKCGGRGFHRATCPANDEAPYLASTLPAPAPTVDEGHASRVLVARLAGAPLSYDGANAVHVWRMSNRTRVSDETSLSRPECECGACDPCAFRAVIRRRRDAGITRILARTPALAEHFGVTREVGWYESAAASLREAACELSSFEDADTKCTCGHDYDPPCEVCAAGFAFDDAWDMVRYARLAIGRAIDRSRA